VAPQAYLYAATRDAVSQKAATCLLVLLGCSTGMFAASTALLPSSFTMYAPLPLTNQPPHPMAPDRESGWFHTPLHAAADDMQSRRRAPVRHRQLE
jgi:hypothetical protein